MLRVRWAGFESRHLEVEFSTLPYDPTFHRDFQSLSSVVSTHLCLAPHKMGIGKVSRPRSDAAF